MSPKNRRANRILIFAGTDENYAKIFLPIEGLNAITRVHLPLRTESKIIHKFHRETDLAAIMAELEAEHLELTCIVKMRKNKALYKQSSTLPMRSQYGIFFA